MRKVIECFLVLGIIILVASAAVWFPWPALCAAAGLAVGFIFGNLYRAKIEKGRLKVIGVEVVRLRNFKASVQSLCNKLR